MSLSQLHRVESNGTVVGVSDQFNLQLVPKQDDSHAVNSDLTGNTMTTECATQNFVQRIPSTANNGVNFFEDLLSWQPQTSTSSGSRRLSISEYNVDNAGYYEYEYFGKHHNEITTQINDNDDEIMMISDEEDVRGFEFDLDGPQRKKVKDYFKLSIFSNSGNGNNGGGGSFWGRKKKTAAEETDASIVINPSQLVFHDTFQEEEDEEEDEGEAITQFTVFDNQMLDQRRPTVPSPAPVSIAKRRSGSMPKTRGRKPSPIPDASKQFGCEFCDRRFKRQEHLKRHVRSLHMCEKPFNCHICDKKFSRSDNLNQHIKTHSHQ